MIINFDKTKNDWLVENRSISFEDVLVCIDEGLILDNLENPNKEKYAGQNILVIEYRNYAWAVPYKLKKDVIELITIYPSRKLTNKYLKGSG